jgi:hypothetical protein
MTGSRWPALMGHADQQTLQMHSASKYCASACMLCDNGACVLRHCQLQNAMILALSPLIVILIIWRSFACGCQPTQMCNDDNEH